MTEEMLVKYDDDKAVEYIRQQMPEAISDSLTDDEIHYVIDLIYDYYEENGFFDEDDDSDVEIDEEDIIEYAIDAAEEDEVREYTDEEIVYIVKGELDYCESIDIFE